MSNIYIIITRFHSCFHLQNLVVPYHLYFFTLKNHSIKSGFPLVQDEGFMVEAGGIKPNHTPQRRRFKLPHKSPYILASISFCGGGPYETFPPSENKNKIKSFFISIMKY